MSLRHRFFRSSDAARRGLPRKSIILILRNVIMKKWDRNYSHESMKSRTCWSTLDLKTEEDKDFMGLNWMPSRLRLYLRNWTFVWPSKHFPSLPCKLYCWRLAQTIQICTMYWARCCEYIKVIWKGPFIKTVGGRPVYCIIPNGFLLITIVPSPKLASLSLYGFRPVCVPPRGNLE